jgi:antagonist of KipI
LQTLNAMLGNSSNSAAVECGLSAGQFAFEAPTTFVVGGAHALLSLSGKDVGQWRTHPADSGDVLEISPSASGRFVYLCVTGGIHTPEVLGSRSTYVPGAIGGIDGRRLKQGDVLPSRMTRARRRHQISDRLPDELVPSRHATIRWISRDDAQFGGEWTVGSASDRMGYRLESDSPAKGASITSEPVCPGAIQLPPGGQPIVLMADAPTIGGYRIAGAVISSDLGTLAQKIPGEKFFFEPVSVAEAQRAAEKEASRIARVREWSLP